MNEAPIITIDGPSGSGKGTVGQVIAQQLGWHFLDSGAIYRVLAYRVMQQNIATNDEQKLADLAQQLPVRFIPANVGKSAKIMLQDQDISKAIRTEACGMTASKISAFAKVRKALLELQRSFQKMPGLVADGRDMGTIVFPNAPVKIFLQASQEERAKRRVLQLQQQGINVSLAQVLKELEQRDRRDQERSVAPLKPASDATIIDTTDLSIGQVVEAILAKKQQLLD